MGVQVREKKAGSGEYWIFINHRGTRKAKKIGDKKTAQAAAKKIEAKLVLGDMDIQDFNRSVPTLKQYAEKWFRLPHKTGSRTIKKYKRSLELHVFPTLGNKPIDQLKRKHFKALFADLILKGKTVESNLQNFKSPLSMIFNNAIDDELVTVNPMAGLSYSKESSLDIKPLTEEEAFTFLDTAKEKDGGRFYPHFLLLLRTGLRVGEMLGLQWSDFDFDKRQITIHRHMYLGELLPMTKNGTSRTVDMTQHLCETMKAYKTAKMKKALKGGFPFSEFCFVLGDRSKPMSEPRVRTALETTLKDAGLRRLRIHDLRHSYATMRLMRGHNIGDVSYQMGHSSIKITFDTYTHWIPGKFSSQVDDLDMRPDATQPQPAKIKNDK